MKKVGGVESSPLGHRLQQPLQSDHSKSLKASAVNIGTQPNPKIPDSSRTRSAG